MLWCWNVCHVDVEKGGGQYSTLWYSCFCVSVFGCCVVVLCTLFASFNVVGYVFDDCVRYGGVVYLVYKFV